MRIPALRRKHGTNIDVSLVLSMRRIARAVQTIWRFGCQGSVPQAALGSAQSSTIVVVPS